MLLTLPSHITWKKPVTEDALSAFGTSDRKKIKTSLQELGQTNLRYEFSELSEPALKDFTEIYHRGLAVKPSPNSIDIQRKVRENHQRKYQILSLREAGKMIGGALFSLRETSLSIAYRMFPRTTSTKLAASPALLAEYLLADYAKEKHKQTIVHGRDTQPYGPRLSIGLAIFKLASGCLPYPSVHATHETFDTDTVTTDSLFILPANTEEPATLILCATESTRARWQQLNSYKDRVNLVEVGRKS